MAANQRYVGTNLVIHWIHSGGTATLSGDWRSLTVTRQLNTADLTAANDGGEYQKGTYKTLGATLSAFYIGTAGASSYGSAALNSEGTLEYYPNGTASGEPIGSFPAVVTEASPDFTYDDGVMVNFNFAPQGDEINDPLVDTV